MKRQKDTTPEEESSRLEGVQHATGEEQRALANSSSKTAVAGPKRQQCSGVGVSGGGSKVRCCKEQCCIATCNVRSMNQVSWTGSNTGDGKFEHRHLSELKWTGMGEFNSDDHYIYFCGQEWNSPHNLMLKLKLQYFGHLMLTHWKRP